MKSKKSKGKKKDLVMYTVTEASWISGYCPETIRRNCRSGKLKHIRLNNPSMIYIQDTTLKSWMDERDPNKRDAIKNLKALLKLKKQEGM